MGNMSDTLNYLKQLLSTQDIRAVLIFLNKLTEHRFTALYQFDNETLKNHCLVDRYNPNCEALPDVPVMAAYCVFVREKKKRFHLTNSLQDERVACHPLRSQIRSYFGVPLLDEKGQVFGTICHFDFEVVAISQENIDLLEMVGPLIKRSQLLKG